MGSFLSGALGTNDKFTAQAAPINQQNFNPALTNSLNQYNQAYQNEGNLAGALTAQAGGYGPNVAQQQLQQATQNNIKQNAGFIASQKGINPALAARQAAENQASIGQQAAGQGAMLGAQQQMAAQQGLQNLYGTQAGQAAGMQNIQQNAQSSQNNAIVSATNASNAANASAAAQNASTAGGIVGGVLNSASGVAHVFGLAKGGEVPKFAPGGQVGGDVSWGYGPAPGMPSLDLANKYIDSGGKALEKGIGGIKIGQEKPKPFDTFGITATPLANGVIAGGPGDNVNNNTPTTTDVDPGWYYGNGPRQDQPVMTAAEGGKVPLSDYDIPEHMKHIVHIYHPMAHQALAQGGKVKAMVSPGEIYLNPKEAKEVAKGKTKATDVGERVPGKPKVQGNSYANDTVPAKLAPGGFVIPNSITESGDTDEKARQFVASRLSADSHEGFHEALRQAIASRGKK